MSDWRRVELVEESELGTFAVRKGRVTLALGAGTWVAAALGLAAGIAWLAMPASVLLLLLAPFLALGAGWIVVGIRALAQERRRCRLLSERPGRRVTVPGTLRMTLRFVAEEHELGEGFGRVPDVDVVCYRLYEDRRELLVPGSSVDPVMGIPLAIPIPAEALERGWVNSLSQRPARYWQLLVEADRPGPDLRSAFFVPVYGPASLSVPKTRPR